MKSNNNVPKTKPKMVKPPIIATDENSSTEQDKTLEKGGEI